MTLQITLDRYAEAVGCNRDTASRRLRGCPRVGLRNQRFALTDILPRLRNRGHAAALIEAAVSDGSLYVGGDEVLPAARKLERFLTADPAMAERLHNVRVSYFAALSDNLKSAVLIRDSERHRVLLAMADSLLPYVVTGSKRGLPFMPDFAKAFAVLHQTAPLEAELVGAW